MSQKLLDFALPPAGAVVYFLDKFHSRMVLGIWWAVLTLICIGNRMVLDRASPPLADIVRRARIRARTQVVTCFLLTAVWSSVAIWAGPILVVATSVVASFRSSRMPRPIPVVVGLSVVYVVLMVWQACMIQIGSMRTLRLESERSDLIESLRKAKRESDLAHEHAVAASRAKSEFLVNMSHELRTPLNAIIGFSDIVRNKSFGDSSAKYFEYGGFIHQSGHDLLDLIDDILDLAKIEAGRKVLIYEPVDVADLIADEASKAGEAARSKGVRVIENLPRTTHPLLKADPHTLRKILGNLLSNAVKFTPAGGHIEVSVLLGAEREITISDTGIGIAPEDHVHIFERLGHGPPEITTAERGSGLGLPIVKGVVDMHGGRLELASAIGEGTRVTVIFPPSSTINENDPRAA